eukprot:2754854-Heterocapsa_arctica.AAC.1
MRKYQMLVNKTQEHYEEGQHLHYKLDGKVAMKYLKEIEEQIDDMRTKLNNERTQRWRNWLDNSWGHKKKYIYKWIRGKKGNGPLIAHNGGSVQMKDIMKLAEDTWG